MAWRRAAAAAATVDIPLKSTDVYYVVAPLTSMMQEAELIADGRLEEDAFAALGVVVVETTFSSVGTRRALRGCCVVWTAWSPDEDNLSLTLNDEYDKTSNVGWRRG